MNEYMVMCRENGLRSIIDKAATIKFLFIYDSMSILHIALLNVCKGILINHSYSLSIYYNKLSSNLSFGTVLNPNILYLVCIFRTFIIISVLLTYERVCYCALFWKEDSDDATQMRRQNAIAPYHT